MNKLDAFQKNKVVLQYESLIRTLEPSSSFIENEKLEEQLKEALQVINRLDFEQCSFSKTSSFLEEFLENQREKTELFVLTSFQGHLMPITKIAKNSFLKFCKEFEPLDFSVCDIRYKTLLAVCESEEGYYYKLSHFESNFEHG